VVVCGIIRIAHQEEFVTRSEVEAISMLLIITPGHVGVTVGVGAVMVGGVVAIILTDGDAILIMDGATGRMIWVSVLS